MKEIRLLTAQEIECRVGRCGLTKTNKAWTTLLLYADARADYKVLDEVFGVTGWQNDYEVINNNLFCTISIWDDVNKQWVRKQNVGTESKTEKEKGEASDALKRAAVAVGIGRELYTAPAIKIWLKQDEYGIIKDEFGKDKVTPYVKFKVKDIAYNDERQICYLQIVDNNDVTRFVEGKRPISKELRDAIADTTKREELAFIYNGNPDLQTDAEFVGLIKARSEELNALEAEKSKEEKAEEKPTSKKKSA